MFSHENSYTITINHECGSGALMLTRKYSEAQCNSVKKFESMIRNE